MQRPKLEWYSMQQCSISVATNTYRSVYQNQWLFQHLNTFRYFLYSNTKYIVSYCWRSTSRQSCAQQFCPDISICVYPQNLPDLDVKGLAGFTLSACSLLQPTMTYNEAVVVSMRKLAP